MRLPVWYVYSRAIQIVRAVRHLNQNFSFMNHEWHSSQAFHLMPSSKMNIRTCFSRVLHFSMLRGQNCCRFAVFYMIKWGRGNCLPMFLTILYNKNLNWLYNILTCFFVFFLPLDCTIWSVLVSSIITKMFKKFRWQRKMFFLFFWFNSIIRFQLLGTVLYFW